MAEWAANGHKVVPEKLGAKAQKFWAELQLDVEAMPSQTVMRSDPQDPDERLAQTIHGRGGDLSELCEMAADESRRAELRERLETLGVRRAAWLRLPP